MTGQRLSYSVGFGLPANTEKLLALLPPDVWQVAYDSDGKVRDGAWVAELVRHEALWMRVEVRDLHRRAVAAVR